MAHILIIDSETQFCESLGAIITGLGHRAECLASLSQARAYSGLPKADIVFLNTALPDGNGIDALPMFRSLPGRPEVIIIADEGDPDGAERAIRGGAWEYVEKRESTDRMVLPLIRALDYRGRKPSRKGEVRLKRNGIIGKGTGITRCFDIVSEAAASDASALLYGETGVGKEVFARVIHDNSHRASGPFVAVDCASLSRTLAGSILFGHRKGAFTGADQDRDGLVAQSNRGTLFLDEVGELPLAMQKIFLRVLQEHRFRPVGGRTELTSDFRLICATNRNLEEMVARGTFRSDLLFRLRTVVMPIPPLRERTEDIPDLANHYIRRLCAKYDMPAKGISPDFISTLQAYHWPGNVRELINTLERAVLASQKEPKLFALHLPEHVRISIARARQGGIDIHDTSDKMSARNGDGFTAKEKHSPASQRSNKRSETFSEPYWSYTAPSTADNSATISHQANMDTDEKTSVERCPSVSDAPAERVSDNQEGISNSDGKNGLGRYDNTMHTSFASYRSERPFADKGTPQHNTPPYGIRDSEHSGPHQNSETPDTDTDNSDIADKNSNSIELPAFFDFRDRVFHHYLCELITLSNRNAQKACEISGLSRSYLYDLMRKYGLSFKQ